MQLEYYLSKNLFLANDDIWLSPFTFFTECTGEKFCNTTGFIDQLQDWSNSYVNFEMESGTEVDIKITKLFGDPITKAVVRPEAVGKAIIESGEVMIRIDNPSLFTVDINGQMDDQVYQNTKYKNKFLFFNSSRIM